MINKRLLALVGNARQYIMKNVLLQWVSLLCNMYITLCVAFLIQSVAEGAFLPEAWALPVAGMLAALLLRVLCTRRMADMVSRSSEQVKEVLRVRIFEKLLRLGRGYGEKVSTAEAVQVAVEGIEQLETYYARYLPQLVYSLLAPLTLFAALAGFSVRISAVLFLCVPLIPVMIMLVQKLAKKLLGQYWTSYTNLGGDFLENLQGLTTLKIYQADKRRNERMNERAESFRKMTMRVLIMQLNSISIMDLVAYGGAAAGAILSILAFRSGTLSLGQALAFLLLSAEFFIPMRILGSYFHVAMNGMAASDRLFRILDMEEPKGGTEPVKEPQSDIRIEGLGFSYEPGREVLHGITMTFPAGRMTALVGESGSGKSTVAALLTGRCSPGSGTVLLGNQPIEAVAQEALSRHITYLSHNSHIFGGTVRENLRIGGRKASETAMKAALKRARLLEFIEAQPDGLDMPVQEGGRNLSGGQRQRLAFARALLHDSPVYVFDEVTSNIDSESEEALMAAIHALSKARTVVLITHRLANVAAADKIYVLRGGTLVEEGAHSSLLSQRNGYYAALYRGQESLESYREEGREEVRDAAI